MLRHRNNGSGSAESALVRLRHHPSVWLLLAGLLVAALLPWPYGYYNFLRITVCAVTAWLAYPYMARVLEDLAAMYDGQAKWYDDRDVLHDMLMS